MVKAQSSKAVVIGLIIKIWIQDICCTNLNYPHNFLYPDLR